MKFSAKKICYNLKTDKILFLFCNIKFKFKIL